MRKLKRFFWIAIGVLTVVVCAFLYAALFNSNALIGGVLLFFGLLIILLAVVVFYKEKSKRKNDNGKLNAYTMVNSLERVFKVVTAEGHFTEIVDFKDTKAKLPLLKSTKKALIIVKAKVHMAMILVN